MRARMMPIEYTTGMLATAPMMMRMMPRIDHS